MDGNGDSMNYVHYSVNHKEGFVNFDNPCVHSQTIKRHWGDMKEVIKRRGVSKKVEQHLYRYRFKKKVSGENASPFNGRSGEIILLFEIYTFIKL